MHSFQTIVSTKLKSKYLKIWAIELIARIIIDNDSNKYKQKYCTNGNWFMYCINIISTSNELVMSQFPYQSNNPLFCLQFYLS